MGSHFILFWILSTECTVWEWGGYLFDISVFGELLTVIPYYHVNCTQRSSGSMNLLFAMVLDWHYNIFSINCTILTQNIVA